MNWHDLKLRLSSWGQKLASVKSLFRARLNNYPNAPKIVFWASAALILIALFCFFIIPFFTGIISDYFENREFNNTVKPLDKERVRHETNANSIANERREAENNWANFQSNRANAQVKSDQSKKALDDQAGEYENAKAGNTNINPNLSLDERRRRVLRTDRELYPGKSGGNANASTNTKR